MSATPLSDVTAHLDAQLASAERLLAVVERQEAAIAQRIPSEIVATASQLQVELAHRARLEEQRTELLARAGAQLGVAPSDVTVEALLDGHPDDEAAPVRERSLRLRKLLAEVAARHQANRQIIHQELRFVEQMIDALGHGDDDGTYTPSTQNHDQTPSSHVLDVRG